MSEYRGESSKSLITSGRNALLLLWRGRCGNRCFRRRLWRSVGTLKIIVNGLVAISAGESTRHRPYLSKRVLSDERKNEAKRTKCSYLADSSRIDHWRRTMQKNHLEVGECSGKQIMWAPAKLVSLITFETQRQSCAARLP